MIHLLIVFALAVLAVWWALGAEDNDYDEQHRRSRGDA